MVAVAVAILLALQALLGSTALAAHSAMPTLDSFVSGTAGLGLDNYKRATVDVNQSLGGLGLDAAAFRLNAMVHESDVSERDVVEYKRKGVSPKGLGSAIRMLQFYINRAGRNLPEKRRTTLEAAKHSLGRLFHHS